MTVLRCGRCQEEFEPLIGDDGEIAIICDMCLGLKDFRRVVKKLPKEKPMRKRKPLKPKDVLMSTEPAFSKEEAAKRALEMRKRWRNKSQG